MVNSYSYWKDIISAVKDNKPLPVGRINEIGSRMSSKTWSSIDGIILCCLANIVKIDAFRHFKGKDRQELFEQFGKQLEFWGILDKVEVHKSNMTYTFPIGSVIEVGGLHSPTQKGEVKLTGKSASNKFKYHFAMAEERYEITDSDWSAVLQALRGSKQFMEIHLANPWILTNDYVSYVNKHLPFNLETLKKEGEQFAVVNKEVKLKNGETYKYKEIFHITNYQINHELSLMDKVKLEIAAEHDPHRANTILYGFYGTPTGSIWKWVIPKMKQKPTQKMTTFIGGVDYGEKNDPTTAYIIGFSDNNEQCLVQHEYYYRNKTNEMHKDTNILAQDVVEHYIDFIEKHNLRGELDVWVDGAAIPFITALNTYCEDIGWDSVIHFYQQNDKKKVADRIETMKTLASFDIIKVDAGCVELWRELNEQTYSDKSRSSIDYVNGDDHGTDAMYYGIAPRWIELLENMNYVSDKLASERLNKNEN